MRHIRAERKYLRSSRRSAPFPPFCAFCSAVSWPVSERLPGRYLGGIPDDASAVSRSVVLAVSWSVVLAVSWSVVLAVSWSVVERCPGRC